MESKKIENAVLILVGIIIVAISIVAGIELFSAKGVPVIVYGILGGTALGLVFGIDGASDLIDKILGRKK